MKSNNENESIEIGNSKLRKPCFESWSHYWAMSLESRLGIVGKWWISFTFYKINRLVNFQTNLWGKDLGTGAIKYEMGRSPPFSTEIQNNFFHFAPLTFMGKINYIPLSPRTLTTASRKGNYYFVPSKKTLQEWKTRNYLN